MWGGYSAGSSLSLILRSRVTISCAHCDTGLDQYVIRPRRGDLIRGLSVVSVRSAGGLPCLIQAGGGDLPVSLFPRRTTGSAVSKWKTTSYRGQS